MLISLLSAETFLFAGLFRLISEALQKMKGKTLEIASSHVSARVLQVSSSLVVVSIYILS